MKLHVRVGLGLSAVALAALTACGGYTTPGTATAPMSSMQSTSSSAGLHTATTKLGTILVNSAGMTIYFYDPDTAGESSSACTGPCASLWPAVSTTSAKPTIAGVTGTVSTITGVDGSKQVTLNGLPLYTYAADTKPGDTTGQGYGGIWWVIGTNGAKISSTPATTPPSQNGGY